MVPFGRLRIDSRLILSSVEGHERAGLALDGESGRRLSLTRRRQML